MNCPKCQTYNRPGARFCSKCGLVLPQQPVPGGPMPVTNRFSIPTNRQAEVVCRNCHQSNRAGANHCAFCGTALPVGTPGGIGRKALWGRFLIGIGAGLRNRKLIGLFGAGAVVLLMVFLVMVVVNSRGNSPLAANPQTPNPTATQTPRDSLRATIEALPSLVPTGGPLATLAEVAAPGGKVEIPKLSDQEEIEIGRQAAIDWETQTPASTDAVLIERVQRIGEKILPFQPRKGIPFVFKVAETDDINAFAFPGGFVYVTHGLLNYVENDDELAGVIGHEIAHVALRHGGQRIEAIAAVNAALARLSTQEPNLGTIYQDQTAQIAAQLAAEVVLNGWGRDAEFQADENGTIFMAHAGFNPQGVLSLFRRFETISTQSNDPLAKLMATHPPFPDRIARVEKTIQDNHL